MEDFSTRKVNHDYPSFSGTDDEGTITNLVFLTQMIEIKQHCRHRSRERFTRLHTILRGQNKCAEVYKPYPLDGVRHLGRFSGVRHLGRFSVPRP
jgi:hypothetical protein